MIPAERFPLFRPSITAEDWIPPLRVLILGASTRAAAFSVIRAGLRPICADLFADLDTCLIAETIPVTSFPSSLPQDVAPVLADFWFYTGGLENHPKILERLIQPRERDRITGCDSASLKPPTYGPLWGTPPTALTLVRDPLAVADTLRSRGLPALEVQFETSPPTADGSWLQKPLLGTGGRAIRVWDRSSARRDFGEPHFFQRRAIGESCSAVFHASKGRAMWLGATQQLINCPESGATIPFAYCGSFGPIDQPGSPVSLSKDVRNTVCQMADALVEAGNLRGLFGIDFMTHGEQVWLLELNPRYTASVEVLELARRQSLFFADIENPTSVTPRTKVSSPFMESRTVVLPDFVAKTILYAQRAMIAPDWSDHLQQGNEWQIPRIADIPVPGTEIKAGWPVCTVFSNNRSAKLCRRILRSRVDSLWKSMEEWQGC